MNLAGWMGLVVLVWFPAAFAWAAVRAGRRGGLQDRCQLLTGAVTAAIGLAFGRVFVPWDIVWPALWGLSAVIAAWGVVTAVQVWPRLPNIASARPRLRLISTVLGLALGIAGVAALS